MQQQLNRMLVAVFAAGFVVFARPADAQTYRTLARPLDVRVAADVSSRLREARYLGEMPTSRVINLNVHLAYPHPDDVRRFADVVNDERSPMYGHFLSPKQFAAAFAPSVATYDGVARELGAHGIKTWRTWSNRKMLNVSATVGTIERYFRTRLVRVAYEGREHFANVTPAIVPTALRGTVMAVVGLDNFELRSHLHRAKNGRRVVVPMPVPNAPVPAPVIPPGITPLDMQTAYDYPYHNDKTADGRGVTIAIEAAYGFSDADINYFWSAFNVTRTGTLTVIDPEGNVPPPIDPVDSAEVTVDVEQSTSSAPGANEKVYTVPAALTLELEDAYNGVVTDPSIDVVSTSFGSCESSTSLPADAADNDTFEQGSSEGQTMFAAAGDDGSSDCRANGPDAVDFPASSIEVGSMGGTTLNLNTDMSIMSETGWSCLATTGVDAAACGNGAGGGGVSTLFSAPPWQASLPNASYVGSRTSATLRNVPDISLNADVNTAYAVWFSGTADLGYGGTSLVGPNFAAIYAEMESKTQHRMGRSSTSIYHAYLSGVNPYTTNIFHDLTVGFNLDGDYTGGTGFKAGPGYDNDTGWGSIDATKFMNSLPKATGPSNL